MHADNVTTEGTAGLEESGAQPALALPVLQLAHHEAWPEAGLMDGRLFLGGGLALAAPHHAAARGGSDDAAQPQDGSQAEAELRSTESVPVRQTTQDAAPETQAGLKSAAAAAEPSAAASEAMEVGQVGGQAEAAPAAPAEAALAALKAEVPTAAPLDAGSAVASLGDAYDAAAADAAAAVVAPIVQDAARASETVGGVTASPQPGAAAPAGLVPAAGAPR